MVNLSIENLHKEFLINWNRQDVEGMAPLFSDNERNSIHGCDKPKWNLEISLFQNAPAEFHGRPELVEQMTKELSELLTNDDVPRHSNL
jgi:hypothetical protein